MNEHMFFHVTWSEQLGWYFFMSSKTPSVFYYLTVDSPTDIKHPACVDDFVL